jgi:hypothetical protein
MGAAATPTQTLPSCTSTRLAHARLALRLTALTSLYDSGASSMTSLGDATRMDMPLAWGACEGFAQTSADV